MPNILIATDNADDAKLVKRQISDEYEDVYTSIDPDAAVKDFESRRPDVLVLAFNSLELAERYYLGLYRLSGLIHSLPHRTVILCNKDELKRVYELCIKDYFDDYILFWPMAHDAKRLAMAIHHALRDLAANKAGASVVEFATQARRLADLELLLMSNSSQGNERVEAARYSIALAEQELSATLGEFSQRLSQGDFPHLVDVKDAQGIWQEIGRLQQERMRSQFQVANESLLQLKASAVEFQEKCVTHLESVHALSAMAAKVPATILVVDDDELARKLALTVLAQENYELIFAASGSEALSLIRKRRPDLILMDLMMPDIDGMETTRRIKSAEHFSSTPIIMVTCNSEKSIVRSCLQAGAADYVVKPFNRELLLAKIRKLLGRTMLQENAN